MQTSGLRQCACVTRRPCSGLSQWKSCRRSPDMRACITGDQVRVLRRQAPILNAGEKRENTHGYVGSTSQTGKTDAHSFRPGKVPSARFAATDTVMSRLSSRPTFYNQDSGCRLVANPHPPPNPTPTLAPKPFRPPPATPPSIPCAQQPPSQTHPLGTPSLRTRPHPRP